MAYKHIFLPIWASLKHSTEFRSHWLNWITHTLSFFCFFDSIIKIDFKNLKIICEIYWIFFSFLHLIFSFFSKRFNIKKTKIAFKLTTRNPILIIKWKPILNRISKVFHMLKINICRRPQKLLLLSNIFLKILKVIFILNKIV